MRNIPPIFAWLLIGLIAVFPARAGEWSAEERKILRSLWIGELAELPPDPGNDVGDNPRAADFGHRLFFDTRLSVNKAVSCASCHRPELAFTDGLKLAKGAGQTSRNSPTIIGAAYSPWYFWDGRKDSQWSQALGPLESPVEHGMKRAGIVDLIRRDRNYRQRYTELFGDVPARKDVTGISRAFANIGKAIAAYERLIKPAPSKFDRYVGAVLNNTSPQPDDQFSLDEIGGLRAFIADNQGQCTRCHNGPLFTDHRFHNIGLDLVGPAQDETGRMDGIETALKDEFNCLNSNDGGLASGSCNKLRRAKRASADLIGAFKTPTLRNVSKTAPYMHGGHYETLVEALWHYREPPVASIGSSELNQLTLTSSQFKQINAFLLTLDSPVDAPGKYLTAPPD